MLPHSARPPSVRRSRRDSFEEPNTRELTDLGISGCNDGRRAGCKQAAQSIAAGSTTHDGFSAEDETRITFHNPVSGRRHTPGLMREVTAFVCLAFFLFSELTVFLPLFHVLPLSVMAMALETAGLQLPWQTCGLLCSRWRMLDIFSFGIHRNPLNLPGGLGGGHWLFAVPECNQPAVHVRGSLYGGHGLLTISGCFRHNVTGRLRGHWLFTFLGS